MTRRPLLLVPVLLAALFFGSCQAPKPAAQPLVLASIYPYELILRQLGGDSLDVRTLIPPDASPHTFSPKPSDLKLLEEATLFVSNGLDLEEGMSQSFARIRDRHVVVSDLLGPELEPGANPHLWLSPQLLIRIVIGLGDELQTRFPDLAPAIGRNSADMVRQLTALHLQIARERGTYTDPALITYHDSFGHFLRDYDIRLLGSVQSSPGREPTPRELSALGELIGQNKVKAVMVEPQMDRKSAKVLANEFGLKLIELDPLGYSFKPATVMDVVLNNWERMKQAW
jgi:zinc transport system substrate-binding protein